MSAFKKELKILQWHTGDKTIFSQGNTPKYLLKTALYANVLLHFSIQRGIF